jgi:hypothetical protein
MRRNLMMKKWAILELRKVLAFLPLAISFIPVSSFGQTNQSETLTIATYYPSPYGVYRNIRLYPSNEPTGTAVSRGVMYFDNAKDTLRFYNNSGWVNISSGSGNAAACVTNTCSYWSTHPCTATCPSGYYATGGGANGNAAEMTESRPSGNDGWYCRGYSGASYPGTCYVRCCP